MPWDPTPLAPNAWRMWQWVEHKHLHCPQCCYWCVTVNTSDKMQGTVCCPPFCPSVCGANHPNDAWTTQLEASYPPKVCVRWMMLGGGYVGVSLTKPLITWHGESGWNLQADTLILGLNVYVENIIIIQENTCLGFHAKYFDNMLSVFEATGVSHTFSTHSISDVMQLYFLLL